MHVTENRDAPYESPLKRQLEERLQNAPESYRDLFAVALARLDHTNPEQVKALLPPDALEFYQKSALRSAALAPLIKHSHESACYIESIVLNHGLAQLALRTLFVMAWQRALMPTPLTREQLAPYYAHVSAAGSVHRLVGSLERNRLVQEYEARELRWLNDMRNRAAHGVIFGEVAATELEAVSLRSLGVATRAVGMSALWFSNPRPLTELPGAQGSGSGRGGPTRS